MQRPLELAPPEVEEFVQLGKTGRQIVVLPDIALQETRMVRHAVQDRGGGQSVSGELTDEVL
jgi:hypothetical protein